MQLINFLFEPRSTIPNEMFRERVLRIMVVIPLVLFSIFGAISLSSNGLTPRWILWNSIIFGIIFSIFVALQYRKIDIASRIFVLSMGLILIDDTSFFWSPGTIIFGLMFTFAFQIIMSNQRDIIIAVLINLGLYTYLAAFPAQPSQLHPSDYFSNPVTALITIYAVHMMIIGITYIIRREQQIRDKMELLIEQQRVDILRQFLGHSSHDLRTMLTRIQGNIYLAKRKTTEASISSVERVEDSVNDLEKLVLSMLDMARLDDTDHFELMTFEIDVLLNDLLKKYRVQAAKKSQVINLVTATDGDKVRVDLQYFTRALGNILNNAITYTPNNNTITVITCRQRNQIIIDIKDTGTGIPVNQLPFIFDSFYRGDEARNQSTGLNGLGLAISKKIIEAHGGKLTVDSEEGVGSTFSLTLPAAR